MAQKRTWKLLPQGDETSKAVDTALRRCSNFLEASTVVSQTGQDFIKVLIASCYLQGAYDVYEGIETRKESIEI